MTRPITEFSDQEYRELYRGDWNTPNHQAARVRGREVLARERAVVATARRLGCRTLLDVGCLDGYLALEACRAGLTVSLLDLDQEIVRTARETLALHGFTFCHTFECLIEQLPALAAEKWDIQLPAWDAVSCTEVIEHVRDPAAVVDVLRRAARTAVILTTPVGHSYDDPLHLWHWDDEAQLVRGLGLDNARFTDVSVERIPSQPGDSGRVFFVVAKV